MATTGFNLESFKGGFKGGARAYLFMYEPNLVEGAYADGKFLVKSTSLPETSIEEITVNWQGADFKMSGKQTFADWTISFNSDKAYALRKEFEKWMELIQNTGDSDISYGSPEDYFANQTLMLLDYEGNQIDTLTLYDAWPKSVGAVTLDYSSQDISQFDVTFTYQYHKFGGGEQ